MKNPKLLLFISLLFLGGCAASPNLIRHAENGPDLETEGVIVYSFQGEGPGILFGAGTYDSGLILILQEMGTQFHTYAFSLEGKHMARQLKAGTYKVYAVSDDLFVVREPLTELPYDKDRDIPIRPFTIEPGEVVYLGDLLATGIRYETYLAGKTESVSYSMRENLDEAKEVLADKFPELVDKMVVRKLELDQ